MSMLRNFALGLVSVFCLVTAVMGQNTRTFDKLPDFYKVDLSGAMHVRMIKDQAQRVVIKCSEECIDRVDVRVVDGVLSIGPNRDYYKQYEATTHVEVYYINLNAIAAGGANKVVVDEASKLVDEFVKLDFSGACNADISMASNNALIDASGAAKVVLKGATDRVGIKSSGAANIDAGGLNVIDMKVVASGAAKILVNTRTLEPQASGAAKVIYVGSPKIVNSQISGAGSVVPKH